MFELKGHKTIIRSLHLIESNKLVLFSDGDNDVLYTGRNKYGNRILGSIILEDDLSNCLRYIHVILTDEEYYKFLYRKCTLLELLEQIENFFIVDFDYAGIEINHALVKLNDIPAKFRPLAKSYCPDFIIEPSFVYSASLKGNYADQHKAYPEDLNSVNTKFSEVLLNATSFINELEIGRQVFVEALQAGSFRINFRIELNEFHQTSIFPTPTNKVKEFVQNYFKYMFNSLPDEEVDVFKKEKVTSKKFKALGTQLLELYSEKNIALTNDAIEQKIIDLFSYTVNSLKEIDFTRSFTKIEFINISKNGQDIPVGLIDNKYVPSVEKRFFPVETLEKPDFVEVDEFEKSYRIQVYQFNTQTGNGGANLIVSEDKLDKIALHAKGKVDYRHTPFTKSMDEGIVVAVKGIATKVNGRVKELLVQY